MKELARVITPDNKDDLLKKAENMSIDNFQEEIKRITKLKGGGGGSVDGEPEEYIRHAFKLKDSEHKIIQAAIDAARAELGDAKDTDRQGFLLSHICDQWLSDPAHYDVGPLEARIKHLEDRYDVKIMQVPKDEMSDGDPDGDMEAHEGNDDPTETEEEFVVGLDESDQQEIEKILDVAGRTNPDLRYEV